MGSRRELSCLCTRNRGSGIGTEGAGWDVGGVYQQGNTKKKNDLLFLLQDIIMNPHISEELFCKFVLLCLYLF